MMDTTGAAGASYADHLTHLGWQDPRLTGDPDQDGAVFPATRSLYCGTALTIPWDPNATSAPSPDPLDAIADSGELNVAVGNTTEDAFTALAGRALHATGASPSRADLQLLRAFLHNVLDVADDKGGDARVRRHIHDASFGATADDATAAESTAAHDAAPAPFVPPPWLATLNDDQHRLDEQLGELYIHQWRLNALWLKCRLADELSPRPGDAPDPDRMRQELDPDRDGSLAHTVRAMTAQVRELSARVPQPDDSSHAGDQDALLAAINLFAPARGLSGGATLKAVPRHPYWQPNNPMVSVAGLLPPADTVRDQQVPVRPLTDDDTSPPGQRRHGRGHDDHRTPRWCRSRADTRRPGPVRAVAGDPRAAGPSTAPTTATPATSASTRTRSRSPASAASARTPAHCSPPG
jgi:hypothetical protein